MGSGGSALAVARSSGGDEHGFAAAGLGWAGL